MPESTAPLPPPKSAWAWYCQDFLKGVCFHLPLVLLLIVLLGLPFNLFGEEFGVVQLVWHQGWWERFLVGAALAMVAIQSLFVSYLLWDRARRNPNLWKDPSRPLSFGRFACCTSVCLVLTVAFLVVLRIAVGEVGAFGATGELGKGEAASNQRVWVASSTDEPRRVWVTAADPEPAAHWSSRAGLVAMLPLGSLAVAAFMWVAGWLGMGRSLANLQLVDKAQDKLVKLDKGLQDQGGSEWTRWRIGAIVTVATVWVTAVAASLWRDAWVPLLCLGVAGLTVFLVTVGKDLRATREEPSGRNWLLFRVNLFTHAILVFVWGSFCLSSYGWWAGLLAFLGAVGLLAALAVSLPRPTGEWLDLRLNGPAEPDEAPATPTPPRPDEAAAALRDEATPRLHRFLHWVGQLFSPPPETPDPLQLWPFVLLAGLVFFLLCNIPAWASPAPIVCFWLFGLVTAYGFATVMVRRAIPVALTALVFFAILAGVQPYKFRYDAYDGESGERVASLDYARPIDLERQIAADLARQRQFDTLLRQYEDARGRHLIKKAKLRENDILLGEPVGYRLSLAAFLVAQAKADREGIIGELAVAQFEVNRDRELLRRAWREMEKENRVLAARHVRGDLELDFLDGDEKGDPLPDDKAGLLRIPHWTLEAVPPEGPLVIVAVSGGGLRSAAWTFTVLRTLEERFAERGIDFPAHVRIITGASGGMFGAAYYVATLPSVRPVGDPEYRAARKRALDALYHRLTRDDLTPLVKQHVYEDLPNLFSPWPSRNDRGKELERAWSRNLGGALDVPLADLRADEKAGRRPSLVFTPMMVEDGRRLIISNLDLRNAITNDGNLLVEKPDVDPYGSECHSREALELFRVFPGSAERFRLSTAVRMSASFPFFSPAVSLPVVPRRRVVDAGYYDNYGVSLAASWLTSRGNHDWILEKSSKILLIQVRDGVDQPQRRLDQLDPDSSTGVSRSLEEMSSPIEGLYNARVSSSSFRNDGQLELLTQFWTSVIGLRNSAATKRPDHTRRPFQVVNFELPQRAALSWYLSTGERDRVRNAMTEASPALGVDYPRRADLLLEWWKNSYKLQDFLRPPDADE